VVARLKQSSFYRGTSTVVIMWGVLLGCGYAASSFIPGDARPLWLVINSGGVLAMVGRGLWRRGRGVAFPGRLFAPLALFFAFGIMCHYLGHFGRRGSETFWPILFMFGYALAGLWLGYAFIVLGTVVAALAFAGYLWAPWLDLYLAVVAGGGIIIAGLW